MKRMLILWMGVVCGLVSLAQAAMGGESTPAMTELRELVRDAEMRFPGSPGNLLLQDKIGRLFESSGLPSGSMSFNTPVFVPGPASLEWAGGEPVRLYTFGPTLGRPGNFAERDFEAPLIYLGRGETADWDRLDGRSLQGAIAVMDYECGDLWLRVLRMGVQGFIFIGSDRYLHADSVAKLYTSEVAVPRYFIPASDGARLRERLQGPAALTARIRSEPSVWREATLRNQWVLIPGQDPALSNEVATLVAPLDSQSAVPELSYGAQSAANLMVLTRLLDTLRQSPPARSILLVAVNGHTLNFLGERMLSWNLLAPQLDVEKVRNTLAQELRSQTVFLEKYKPLIFDGAHDQTNEAYLVNLRFMSDDTSGKILSIKEPAVAMAKRDLNQVKSRMAELFRSGLDKDDNRVQYARLKGERDEFTHVLTLFNKVGIVSLWGELTPNERGILKGYISEIRSMLTSGIELNRKDLAVSTENSRIRAVLAGRQVVLALSLDLDWQTDDYGFSANNSWGTKRWPARFGANLTRVVQTDGGINHFRDTLSLLGGLPEGHYFNSESSGLIVFHAASATPDKGGTPAFSLRNLFSNPGAAFSPGDTLDSLDPARVETLCAEIPRFFQAFLADRKLTMQGELDRPKERYDFESRLWSIRVRTFKFDEFAAGVVPTTPVRNTLLVLNDGSLGTMGPVVGTDVINAYIALTDHRAAAVVYGIFRLGPLYCAAFQYDSAYGKVLHALDIGEVSGRVPSSVANLNEQTLALFSVGEEIPVFARNDSSLLGAGAIQANNFIFLEARNNSSPRKYYVTGATATLSKRGPIPVLSGPAAFFTDGRETVKIMTDQKRLAIRPTEKQPDGIGYRTRAELGDDFMAVAARDMESLNRQRISRLRGVSDELAQEFLEKGRVQLVGMNAAQAEHRHLAYLKSLYVALGAQTKAYLQQSLITNDMLKAVVFYMALMLPFCFFLQKLIFNFTKVEAQMGAFVLLFMGTYVLFRTIHPAFHVAQAPEAMFIAFVMGALGAFVIHILHGRFEGEMHVLFHTVVGTDSSDVGYSTVTQQAMLIGVNNMKRRRIRTALTTGTIVLVTFTMLAFTSISKKMSPTIVAQGKQAPYTGLLFHMPGAPMDEASLEVLSELFSGEGDAVVRRWTLAPSTKESSYPWRLDLPGTNRDVRIEAVLGLDRKEDGFLSSLPLVAGGRFFSADDAEEAILMSATALALGVTPAQVAAGISVRFQGRILRVVGIMDDERFSEIKDLDGLPLLPIKKMLTQAGAADASAPSMSADENTRSGVLFADAATVLVLPQLTARSFKAAPYSFSIRFKPGTAIWTVVEKLLTATQAKFYISSTEGFAPSAQSKHKTEPGIYYVGTGYHTAIGGLNVLIIPLLIASTIILNTMLGAVFERKNEIAIYNAVGLNPTHIGTFFLAEAFVYSVIGSIGGYLIGQLLSIGLNHFHLVQGINLNFSSLSVVYVIVFTILVVMLSTLYPAIVATKAAVPSGKRTWSMPAHDGLRMELLMPFICRPDLIVGMMAYLEDYFDRFTEASVGEIIARLESRERGRDAAGRETYTLRYNLALAPFDLGVTQTVEFHAAFDDQLSAYRIRLRIDRVSGQDNNWVTTNRPFLEKLRAYLMHWRNLGASQQGLFVERGTQTHAATADATKA
jgi:ABC-type antimicrobial peptide transport system permease subunit